MLDQLLTSEYLFWLVAFSFFIFDNTKLISKNELLIAETVTGFYKPLISFNTFEIKNKQVHLLNLLTPFTGFIKLNTTPNSDPSKDYDLTVTKLAKLKKSIFIFKTISLLSFIYLSAGVFLTHFLGLGYALLLLLPIHGSTLLLTIVLIFIRRKGLNLSLPQSFNLIFELIVVPAYLPNIVRKIYSKNLFNSDGYYFSIKQTKTADETETLDHLIRRKFEQMIADSNDEKSSLAYENYEKALAIKND